MSGAMIGAMDTTLMLCVSGAIAISPPATPASAVMSGSSMASSEPNAMNSTIAAASTPTTVPRPGDGCFSMAGPPSWTSSPGSRAACAALDHPADVRLGQVAGLLGEVDDGVGGAVVLADLRGLRPDHRG